MGGKAMKRTALVLLALLTMAGPAHAFMVSPKVGPLINAAQSLAQAGDYKGALAKVGEAEAVKSYPDDETVIQQMRQYLVRASLDPAVPHCINARMGLTGCDGRAIEAQRVPISPSGSK
jgi:hypothetical protein